MSVATWKPVMTTCAYIKMKAGDWARPYGQKQVMLSASYIKTMFICNHLRTAISSSAYRNFFLIS